MRVVCLGRLSQFTGKERDAESGLDYFGARYFGSSMGRFMSPDDFTKDTHVADPQSWNLYAYARNNCASLTRPVKMQRSRRVVQLIQVATRLATSIFQHDIQATGCTAPQQIANALNGPVNFRSVNGGDWPIRRAGGRYHRLTKSNPSRKRAPFGNVKSARRSTSEPSIC
jgi:RHS repeat-associated protein